MCNKSQQAERSTPQTTKGKYPFAISIVCVVFGALIRLIYCIRYPVQPRDAYSYSQIISLWEESGITPRNTNFFPLSLWFLKTPHHLFQYDSMKSGIMVNMLLGLLIIAIIVNIANHLFKNNYTILFAGLAAATHPALVTFSCSCLRENTYLFFTILTISFLVRYCIRPHFSHLFFAGIFGATAFLCRLEGLEILPIVFVVFFFLFIFKKIRFSKAVLHGIAFLVVYSLAVLSICYCFGFREITKEEIMMRFQLESLN